MVIVNTQPKSQEANLLESGFHWNLSVFRKLKREENKSKKTGSHDEEVHMLLMDPLGTELYAKELAETINRESDSLKIKIDKVALDWQRYGWRCGYYVIYVLLAASMDIQNAGNTDNYFADPTKSFRKMPDGFEEVMWSSARRGWTFLSMELTRSP